MLIVRHATLDDLDSLLRLAKQASPGMTTFPPEMSALEAKVKLAMRSVSSDVLEPNDETYMLVMEDTSNQRVVGTASVIARLGEHDQFYSYKLNKMTYQHRPLDTKTTVQTLLLSNHFEGFAEVATLYLDEDWRKNGNGKLLSKSRYLFMAQFRQRFPEQVMADLRGYFDDSGRSPFWEAIGRKFFDMDFSDADLYGALNGNQFIADLMPKQAIYVNLLPNDAQQAIGRPNDQGKGALAMLEKEGFRWNGHVDIFDGSPSVDVPIDQLITIRDSETAEVDSSPASSEPNPNRYLVANTSIDDFRVCVSEISRLDGAVRLPEECLDALRIQSGDVVRFIKL